MGKKGKEKKSKGPRGKKAREAKKLERRWGEIVPEEQIQNARIRKGRLRLSEEEAKARISHNSHNYQTSSLLPSNLAKKEKSNHLQTKKVIHSSITSFTHHSYANAEDNDDDSNQDNDLFEHLNNNIGQDSTNGSTLQSLLKSIQKKKSQQSHMIHQVDLKRRNEMDDESSIDAFEETDGDYEEEEYDMEEESTHEEDRCDESTVKQAEDDDDDDDDNEIKCKAGVSNNTCMVESKEEEDSEEEEGLHMVEYLKKNYHNPFFRHFFPNEERTEMSIEQHSSQKPSFAVPTIFLNPSLQLHLSQQVLEVFQRIMMNPSSSPSSSSNREQQQQQQHVSLIEKFPEIAGKIFHQYCQYRLVQEWKIFNSTALRENVDAAREDTINRKMELPLLSNTYFSSLQAILYPFMAQYVDLLVTCETRQNTASIQNLILVHTLNHILTSNRLISRNDKFLKNDQSRKEDFDEAHKKTKKKKNTSSATTLENKDDDESLKNVRDQGYTRPKVLILMPTKGTCLLFVQKLLQLLDKSSTKVDQWERFETEYSSLPQSHEDEESNHTDAETKRRRKNVLKEKGLDWLELFGDEVNSDDDFKIGLSFQHVNSRMTSKGNASSPRRHVHVKLYSEFYHSDLILASPLALKIHGDTEVEDSLDRDFLSSIEICILSNCDTLLMQNWDHVNSVLDMMNKQPTKIQGIDFSRVRDYCLSGLASKFRQLVVLSKFMDANILSTFKKYSSSVSGQIKLRRKCSEDEASLCNVSIRVPQVFQRITSESFLSQGDDRLKYFTNKVLPHILRLQQKHTMIYIPSYFDFTSVRNVLLKKEASFVSVTEYSRTSEISRGRAHFLQGRKNIMLYTGRSFFFMRHFIKGVRHVILFGVPEHAEFYYQLVNMLSDATPASGRDNSDLSLNEPLSSLCLFTKYDAHALERIVGTNHCELMIIGEKATFLFNN